MEEKDFLFKELAKLLKLIRKIILAFIIISIISFLVMVMVHLDHAHAVDNEWVEISKNKEKILYVKKGNDVPVGIYEKETTIVLD